MFRGRGDGGLIGNYARPPHVEPGWLLHRATSRPWLRRYFTIVEQDRQTDRRASTPTLPVEKFLGSPLVALAAVTGSPRVRVNWPRPSRAEARSHSDAEAHAHAAST